MANVQTMKIEAKLMRSDEARMWNKATLAKTYCVRAAYGHCGRMLATMANLLEAQARGQEVGYAREAMVAALRSIAEWEPSLPPDSPKGMSIMEAIDMAQAALDKDDDGKDRP